MTNVLRLKNLLIVDAKGRQYCYLRRPRVRIPHEYGSPAFLAEYARLMQLKEEAKAPAGTLGALIDAYRASPEFRGLSERSRKDYDRVFYWLKPVQTMPVKLVDGPYVIGARDLAFKKHKRRFANYVVQVLSLLFNWGRPRGLIASNPAADVPKLRRPRSEAPANRAWTPLEREAVLAAASATQLAVIALGMFAGLREGDAVRFAWSGYDGAALRFRQGKTGGLVEMPAHPRLREILDQTARVSPIVATTALGTPWTLNGFRAGFFALLRRLESEGKVGTGLTFHGLRHTLGALLDDAGADTRTIAAVLGHRSEAMARHYSQAGDARRRTADGMKKIERLERKRSANLQNSRTKTAKLPKTAGEQ